MANNNHFELTLDTLAPSGSITRTEVFVNAQTTCTIAKGDATYMCAWFDNNATGTLPDSPTWVAADTSVTSSFATEGIYYGHVCLMDDVNNKSAVYNTESITYDTTAPTVSDVLINSGAAYTTHKTGNTISFSFEDTGAAPSGPVSYKISGDGLAADITGTFTAEQIGAKTISVPFDFKSDASEGTQVLNVTVTDAAGNTCPAESDSIILDTQSAVGHLALYNTADTAAVTEFINYVAITGRVDASSDANWADYKVWVASDTEPSTWTDVTAAQKAAGYASVALTLATGDGEKVVYGKVRDEAQKEAGANPEAFSATVKLDQTKPSVSIASDVTYISKVDTFDEATITPTIDMNPTTMSAGLFAPIKSWELKRDGTTIKQGTTMPSEPFVLTTADLTEVEGAHSLTLTVTDTAENTQTSTAVVVNVDLTAPVGTITMPAWLNGDSADHTTYPAYSGAGATASATDGGSGLAYMTCWVSQTATDTIVPATATQVAYAENPMHGNIDWTSHGESATNYLHIKYVDAVGNESVAHSAAFGIDTEAPKSEDISVDFTKDAYPSTSAAVDLLASDSVSGMGAGAKFKIWGDITEAATEAAAEWQAMASSKSVTLTTGDGMKDVYVKYMDVAGNISSQTTDNTELDTSKPSGTLSLLDTNESKAVDPIRNIADFVAHITYTDDALGGVQYKIYGDFTFGEQKEQGITEAEAEWNDFVYDSGVQYKKIANMFCTSGDGTKTVYIKVKDNAGNVSDPISAAFEYDTTAPTVTVSGVDYNRISKVNELRRNASGTIAGKYADETNFVFTPDSKIQAYKVCAYLDEAAAKAGSHADDAIPTTAGSVNMSATGLSSEAAVSAKIKGADYEAALGEAGKVDGAHFVVVYVQDLGGTWSIAASFEA